MRHHDEEMTHETDREDIASTAYRDIFNKYKRGKKEHATRFWTAGALWYAAQARDEAVDQMAYTHHLIIKLRQATMRLHAVRNMLSEKENNASDIIKHIDHVLGLLSCEPPEPCEIEEILQ